MLTVTVADLTSKCLDMKHLLSQLRKIPFWVVAALLPFAFLGAARWYTGGGQQVLVIGAGPIASATRDTEPSGIAFYDLDVQEKRSTQQTEATLRRALSDWPDVIMFGFATEGLSETELIELVSTYEAIALESENTATIPVMVGIPAQHSKEANRLWRETVCSKHTESKVAPIDLRVCVDPSEYLGDINAMRQAIASGAKRGVERVTQMRDSTQVGR